MDYVSTSPICHCDVIDTPVHVDQTQQECAHEHRCASACPLAENFVRITEPYRGSKTWE